MRDGSLRGDLLSEAESGDPLGLVSHEMLAYLDELRARRPWGRDASLSPEFFLSTDRVVIVPGLMGSSLSDTRRRGRGLVWVNPMAVLSDRLGTLKLAPYDGLEEDDDRSVRIEASGPLPLLYDLLRLALEVRRYATEFFAFDWRRDLEIASQALAKRLRQLGQGSKPIHMVAHSQGALVARRALQILGPEEARRLVRHLVLLGPANFGSFSAVLALAGGGSMLGILRRLAVEPARGFGDVLSTMSGLYQLVPWDASRAPWLGEVDLSLPEVWGPSSRVDSLRLRRFLGWGRGLDTTFFDDRTAVILGEQASTAGGAVLNDPTPVDSASHAMPGDGTVPHALSVLAGVRTFLASGVEHSMLGSSRRVIEATCAVLAGGSVELPSVSSDPRDHQSRLAARGPSGSPPPDPSPRQLQMLPSTSPTPSLNGRFLSGYDAQRALPQVGRDEPEVVARVAPVAPELPLWGRFLQSSGPPPTEEVVRASCAGRCSPEDGQPCRNRNGCPGDGSCAELVLDGSNLLPFHFLRVGDRLGRAVVKLQRSDGAAGTGFLVAPDVLLTNHHVLPDRETARGTRALANYEAQPPSDTAGRAAIVRLDPDSLFVGNADLDFTFCGVPGLEFLGAVPLDRNSLAAGPAECVNIVQHPGGRPKEVALQDNRVVRSDNLVIQYACDTEPGSSGSPVFDNRWKLVALHHASVRADAGLAADAPADPGSRYLNEGIRLSAIAAWLETDDAEQQYGPAALGRLRSIFRGLDPQIGYFGGLGRGGQGRRPTETVVDLYHGVGGDLDLGFWDLGGPARQRRSGVARVLGAMGGDVWCLSHVDPEDLAALAAELKIRTGIEHRTMAGPGRTALLYRDRPGLVVEQADAGAASFPWAVRLRATTATGKSYELNLAPLAGMEEMRDLMEPGEADWMFLGSADFDALVGSVGQPSGRGRRVAAAAGKVGFLLITGPGSPVVKVFATPDLGPIGDKDRRLVVVERQLPNAARTLGASPPVALRLCLRQPMAEEERVTRREPSDEKPSGRAPVDGQASSVEAALIDALRPVIARLVDELRRQGERPR